MPVCGQAGIANQQTEQQDAAGSSTANGTGPPTDISMEAKSGPWLQGHHKVICGGVIMVACGFTWVGATQLAKLTYRKDFRAPFFVVYFSTLWVIIFFPIYLIASLVYTRGQISMKETLRESLGVYRAIGENNYFRPKIHHVLGKCLLFCVLWTLTNYLYLRSLDMKPSLDVTALFATNSSFIYLLSWIILHEKFIAIRIVGLILSLMGVILMMYMNAFGGKPMWGAVLAVSSAAGAAAYKVLFKKIIGDATFGQLSIFLSFLGLFNLMTMWPILLALHFTKAEVINWASIPWDVLCGSAALALAFNLLATYGLLVTYPVFIQTGLVFGIPICAGADILWWRLEFGGMQIAAIVLIVISFFLNILPDNWHDSCFRFIRIKRREDPRNQQELSHMGPRQRLRSTANLTY